MKNLIPGSADFTVKVDGCRIPTEAQGPVSAVGKGEARHDHLVAKNTNNKLSLKIKHVYVDAQTSTHEEQRLYGIATLHRWP